MKDKKCMALLELKSVIFKRKNKTNKINWRIDTTEEIIGKLENTAMSNGVSETDFKQWNNTIRFTFLKVTLAIRGRLDTYEKSTLGFMLNPHFSVCIFHKVCSPSYKWQKRIIFPKPLLWGTACWIMIKISLKLLFFYFLFF